MPTLPSPGALALATSAIACLAFASCNLRHRAPDIHVDGLEVTIGAYRLPDFPSPAYWTRTGPTADIPLVSAHRGRPDEPRFPENSLEGLRRLHAFGDFIAEIDVMRSRDGVLFLFHDRELDRRTANTGPAGERTWAELDTMRLRAPDGTLTDYTIPSLDEVLAFAKGRLLVSLDRKGATTYQQLADAAAEHDMTDDVSLILYDEDDFRAFLALSPKPAMNQGVRTLGQVATLAAGCKEWYAGDCPVNLFLGVGDLDRYLVEAASTTGLRSILGTFGRLDEMAAANDGVTYRELHADGVSVIATNQPLLAARALYGRRGVSGFGGSPTAPSENTTAPR